MQLTTPVLEFAHHERRSIASDRFFDRYGCISWIVVPSGKMIHGWALRVQ